MTVNKTLVPDRITREADISVRLRVEQVRKGQRLHLMPVFCNVQVKIRQAEIRVINVLATFRMNGQ